MSFDLDLGDVNSEKDLRGRVIPEPGIYHVVVGDVDLHPVNHKGEVVEGIRVPFQVATGTVKGQRDRVWDETFSAPSPTHKDGGRFARQRATLLGLATEVISHDQLGSHVKPNWADMGGKHLIVKVFHEKRPGDNGKEFVNCKIEGANIWHVNDLDAANFPKDEELLELMPMSWKPEGTATEAEKPAAAAPAKAAPKPGAPKPGAKRTAAAANGGGANGGTATATAAAPTQAAADPYDDL